MADKAYQSELAYILSPFKGRNLTFQQYLINEMINKDRIVIENVFARFKNFGILKVTLDNFSLLCIDYLQKRLILETTSNFIR